MSEDNLDARRTLHDSINETASIRLQAEIIVARGDMIDSTARDGLRTIIALADGLHARLLGLLRELARQDSG